jgi:glyceraldehyde 3-phosphate dehydrogenase
MGRLFYFNKMRIAINGFGRIGRSFLRVIESHPEIEVVAINDLADIHNQAHLLKYDTTHRLFPNDISVEGNTLLIGERTIAYSSHRNLENAPWETLDLDVILEATGLFREQTLLQSHLAKAKKVIISAPPLDETRTVVMGINEGYILASDRVLSNASCTTNSAAPLVEVVARLCGIEHAYITTVHSYTTDQRLQDGPHKDFRRGRAAAESIVPTTTGAAKAITRIFPHLKGRIGGAGIRVPVPNGSLTDITFTVKKIASVEAVNNAFREASETYLSPYLGYTADPIVSRDVIGSPYSCLYDEGLTSVLGPMLKVVAWYDNEMGYAHRLKDLVLYLARQKFI